MSIIYLDGKFVPDSEAKVSVFDHGVLYGDGCFEGIRLYNKRVFKLDEHVRRLYDSAHTIMLDVPISKAEYAKAICETCAKNNLTDGYIRAVITRGKGDLGLDPRKCAKPTVFIIADNITLYPDSCYTEGLRMITCATRRVNPTALDPAVKSLNYLNNILAKIECARAGMDEGLMINEQGYVAEATGDNVFAIRDGKLYTPPVAAGILRGVTRDTVIDLAKARGIEVHEEFFTLQFVYNADEVFLTGTAAEALPVREVDGRKIGTGRAGELTTALIADFRKFAASTGTPIE